MQELSVDDGNFDKALFEFYMNHVRAICLLVVLAFFYMLFPLPLVDSPLHSFVIFSETKMLETEAFMRRHKECG